MAQNKDKQTIEEVKSPIAEKEEKILQFWKDNAVFQKSLDKHAPKGEYVFYDGPPFATGLPHYGHILGSAVKDTVARYQTMRGFRVERKWGWDCHGLPIENIVEKDLNISGRKEIEKIGIDTFNEYARSKVLDYVSHWKTTVDRMGRWVDFDGSYKTMDNTFIESVWWAFGEIQKKGLVYEGVRVLPYCPRCETPIANSEIAMDHSYKNITDISVYLKLELASEPGTFLLAWTTTPWTLPGNTAAAVNKEVTYVKVKEVKEEKTSYYIIAKDLFPKLADKFLNPEIVEELQGDALIGKSYVPPFDYFIKNPDLPNHSQGWKVYAASYVTTESGTGIVHLAPAYGEEDMDLAKKEKIPFVRHVGSDGKFIGEVTDFAGEKAKSKEDHQAGDVLIIKNLAPRGLLFAKEKIIHSYPHCFRCETPLYYFALDAWFINIQKVKQRMLDLNQDVDWVPDHLKNGRFGKSMEGAPDWNISRNRYWASPLPIWKSENGKEVLFIDSIETLKKHTKKSGNTYFVMRHGGTESNKKEIISFAKQEFDHITEDGKKEVVQVAKGLEDKKIDIIIASPFVRTKETALMVAEILGINEGNIFFDKRIQEINPGVYDGGKWPEYHDRMSQVGADWFKERPGNSESLFDCQKRVGEFLYEIENKYKGKNILFVTHGGPAWLFFVNAGLFSPNDKTYRSADSHIFVDEFKRFDNAEVRELSFTPLPHNKDFELDLHRPYIDDIILVGESGNELKRIKEVFDCWFESGSMPFAQQHYPFENKEWFRTHFPSDFIAEYIAQTRTWFYYMHAISVMVFDSIAFKHVVTTGTVLAEDGQKMSKSKGNFPDPTILFDKYGVDAIRFYMLSSPLMKSEDLNFSERGVDEVYKKNILRTQNVLSFYDLYRDDSLEKVKSSNVLDLWILARLNGVVREVTSGMECYRLDEAHAPIDLFVDDLSTWYLRRSRERLKGEDKKDRVEALSTFSAVLEIFSRTIAPFLPFLAEDIHRHIHTKDAESVHLMSWPEVSRDANDEEEPLSLMKEVRRIVSLGLEARSRAGVKVRQPLACLTVKSLLLASKKQYVELIEDEINVKKIEFDGLLEPEVSIDTTITPELRQEGDIRELMRAIQDMRKENNFSASDKVDVTLTLTEEGKKAVEVWKKEIMATCSIGNLSIADKEGNGEDWFSITL